MFVMGFRYAAAVANLRDQRAGLRLIPDCSGISFWQAAIDSVRAFSELFFEHAHAAELLVAAFDQLVCRDLSKFADSCDQ